MDEKKIPWVTVAVLAILCIATLGTGVFHWHRNYFSPADYAAYVSTDVEPPSRDFEYDESAPGELAETELAEIFDDVPEIIRPDIEPLPEFVALREEHDNDDIVAVLTLADNEVLVMQTDNNEFYLTHDINREPSEAGSVFMDSETDLLMGFDHNFVVHVPPGNALRQILQEYASYDFFLIHPTISLFTLYGNFDWEIFAFYIAPDAFPFMTVNHPDDDAWGIAVEQFTLAALYNTRLDVTLYDQIITITSPIEAGSNFYYVLQARMLRHITS
ncbi:MAG: class B sortase [Defluviitaleaceae bacterium]|nr:class B sortase [Defluviitaleaceae bacterium]